MNERADPNLYSTLAADSQLMENLPHLFVPQFPHLQTMFTVLYRNLYLKCVIDSSNPISIQHCAVRVCAEWPCFLLLCETSYLSGHQATGRNMESMRLEW